MRLEFKEKLDQMSEQGLLNIVSAYNDLPRQFPIDLLDDIKEMVYLTVRHSPQKIKSYFLLDFINRFLVLRKKFRIDPKEIDLLTNEIINKLNQNDEYLCKGRSIEKLVNVYNIYLPNKKLN